MSCLSAASATFHRHLIQICLLFTIWALNACVRAPEESRPAQPVFFPPPPQEARVQYLGWISSPRDLPPRRSGFAEFILGEEPLRYVPAKPNKALLSGENLYISDSILNTVLIYNLHTGEADFLRGDRGNGKISQPNNIKFDEQGWLYVADKTRQAVLIYDQAGEFLHAWGRPGEVAPVDVAIGKDRLYICDMKDHQIEIWDRANGTYLKSVGERGNAPGQFFFPTHCALDGEGNLYVTDTGNFRVQKLDPDGNAIATFGKHGTSLGSFAWPKGLAIDGEGRIYVADTRFANVQIFNPEFKLLLFFGGPGPDRGSLDLPAGLQVIPWPANLQWLQTRLAPGFDPEYLVVAVSQKGVGLVNFFAVARDDEE